MAENTHFEFDIVITRGDSRTYPLEFYQNDGTTAEDVSLWEFFYTAKASLKDADGDAAITLDPDDFTLKNPGAGDNEIDLIFTQTMTDVAPKDYHHDFQIVNSFGVSTFFKGKITIEMVPL